MSFFPSSVFDLKFKKMDTIEELAVITFGAITALEEVFGLERKWQQATPDGVKADEEGLSSLQFKSQNDLTKFFKERGWEEWFSGERKSPSGYFYNETVIVQLKPQEFGIYLEHMGTEELFTWRIEIIARGQKLNRKLFVKCAKLIFKQNEQRDGLVHCSYKTAQEHMGKYMPSALTEEVFVHSVGSLRTTI